MLCREAQRAAQRDIPILVQGETGTGKELAAEMIHAWSGRSGALVALNCAAIPESVAEAELFGHKKGAFTGAQQSSLGHIAAAHAGTLFLDEVPDLPRAVQTKLLRALEQKRVTPLGGVESRAVDFRLVAASQEPLEELVEEGEFRRDLFARLAGAELKLPPLHRRREEVLPLFELVLRANREEPFALDPRFVEALCVQRWKGNVRELVQLARLLASSTKSRFERDDLPAKYRDTDPKMSASQSGEHVGASPQRRQAWLERHAEEFASLKAAMLEVGGNLSEASRRTGIPRYRARRMLQAGAERD
jgi:DNA-binding NtrC family response regulator